MYTNKFWTYRTVKIIQQEIHVVCLPGYTGNPLKGIPCEANEEISACDCDSQGTLLPCQDNRCICKV